MKSIQDLEGTIKILKERLKKGSEPSNEDPKGPTLRSLRKALKRKQRKRRVMLEDIRRMETRKKKKKAGQAKAGG